MRERDNKGRFKRKYNDNPSLLSLKTPRHILRDRKLNEDDIKSINQLYKQGHTQTYLSKVYKVAQSTIWYWLQSDEYRERFKNRSRKKYSYPEKHAALHQDYKKRLEQAGFPFNEKQAMVMRKFRGKNLLS